MHIQILFEGKQGVQHCRSEVSGISVNAKVALHIPIH